MNMSDTLFLGSDTLFLGNEDFVNEIPKIEVRKKILNSEMVVNKDTGEVVKSRFGETGDRIEYCLVSLPL